MKKYRLRQDRTRVTFATPKHKTEIDQVNSIATKYFYNNIKIEVKECIEFFIK